MRIIVVVLANGNEAEVEAGLPLVTNSLAVFQSESLPCTSKTQFDLSCCAGVLLVEIRSRTISSSRFELFIILSILRLEPVICILLRTLSLPRAVRILRRARCARAGLIVKDYKTTYTHHFSDSRSSNVAMSYQYEAFQGQPGSEDPSGSGASNGQPPQNSMQPPGPSPALLSRRTLRTTRDCHR
ncbi:hypothetical protein MRB53_038092 [Persea americana]|nr:hypothetical protein MRB53_038092 [Persea americana]